MGKGDNYRPVDKARYDRNWDRIFKPAVDQSEEEVNPTVDPDVNPADRKRKG